VSILNRKMFSHGGYAHRGTGITSGLTPVRMHEGGVANHKHTYMPDKSDAEVMELLQAGSLTTTTPGDTYQGTEVPTLEQLYEKKLPVAQRLFGDPIEPMSKMERLSPWLMNLGASLMSGKSLQGGFSGAMEIMGNAMKESTPALTEAMAMKRAEERANRAEEIEAAKIAYQSAETERASLLDQASSLASTKIKLDAPEIGDTLFLVPEDKSQVPENVIMAYQKEETIDGKRIKNLYDFDGNLLKGKFTTYKGKDKPKEFSGINVKFSIPGETEDDDPTELERMAIGRFEFDEDTGEYKVNYYYKDDEGNEQELPGNAVIISREGDASTIGQGANVKEEKALTEQEIAGTKFIMKAIDAYNVIKASPGAVTDVGDLAVFADRIIADAKAFIALMGGTYEVDESKLENYLETDLGITSSKLKSVYLDLAISRAVFVEGGTRVTDQDVINQLRIIGARAKAPEAALVLLKDFVYDTARNFSMENNIRAEKNNLISSVDENYLLRNLTLPWNDTGTGTVGDGNQDNKTIGAGSGDDVEALIKKILEEKLANE
jgi:hypothetical protein